MDLVTILDAIQTLAIPALAVIGITGGLKGLIAQLPTVTAGGLVIPGGIVLSWAVGLAWVIGGVVLGGVPEGVDAMTYIGSQWALVSATANVVRNWMTSG